MKLLSISSDAKTVKGEKKGYLTGILYLAPAFEAGITDAAGHKVTLCPFASPGCTAACLYSAGRAAIFPAIKAARIEKTKALYSDPQGFKAQLAKDIAALIKKAKKEGMTPAVRLNGTSDLPVETWGLMEAFPEIQFYDYSKNPAKAQAYAAGKLPKNYHVTFSLSETNEHHAVQALAVGVNVAAVYAGPMPQTVLAAPVLDGDESDLRFLDPAGHVVALKAKGMAKKDVKGFSVAYNYEA